MTFFQKKYDLCSDETLMKYVKQHKAAAFDVLYLRYSQRLLAYFYRMLGNDREKAQDFLQDIFLKMIHKSHLYRDGAKFSTWIFSIAHNMCKNEYRRLDVRKIMDNEADPHDAAFFAGAFLPDIAGQLDQENFQNKVREILLCCDENQRTTFVLRFQEQLSIREISDILGCSEGTTKSRLFYITKKLAKELSDYNPQKMEF